MRAGCRRRTSGWSARVSRSRPVAAGAGAASAGSSGFRTMGTPRVHVRDLLRW